MLVFVGAVVVAIAVAAAVVAVAAAVVAVAVIAVVAVAAVAAVAVLSAGAVAADDNRRKKATSTKPNCKAIQKSKVKKLNTCTSMHKPDCNKTQW